MLAIAHLSWPLLLVACWHVQRRVGREAGASRASASRKQEN